MAKILSLNKINKKIFYPILLLVILYLREFLYVKILEDKNTDEIPMFLESLSKIPFIIIYIISEKLASRRKHSFSGIAHSNRKKLNFKNQTENKNVEIQNKQHFRRSSSDFFVENYGGTFKIMKFFIISFLTCIVYCLGFLIGNKGKNITLLISALSFVPRCLGILIFLLLSWNLLNYKITKKKKTSIIIILIGMIIYFIPITYSLLNNKDVEIYFFTKDAKRSVVFANGLLLSTVICFIIISKEVIEKYMIVYEFISIYNLIFIEGVCEIILFITAILFFYNIIDFYKVLWNNIKNHVIYFIIYLICQFFQNYFRIMTIYFFNPGYRLQMDVMFTFSIFFFVKTLKFNALFICLFCIAIIISSFGFFIYNDVLRVNFLENNNRVSELFTEGIQLSENALYKEIDDFYSNDGLLMSERAIN